MASLCRTCGDKEEITTSLLDTSRHHLQWAINHFHIELDGVLPTSVCVHCDDIIRQWTLFLSKLEKANSLFSTMTANNQSLLHQLTSDTSNTSVPSKPSTSLCPTRLGHQLSNNVQQLPSVDCISVNDNSILARPIEAIFIPDKKSEIDFDECEISLEDPFKNQDADKKSSIHIEKPSYTALSYLPGTERLQHPQEPRQLTSHTSLSDKPSCCVLSNTQCSISTNSSPFLSDLDLLQHLVKKYHIKDLTIILSRLGDQVLDSLQQNGTVDCNVVDNQMSEQRNVRIKLEPVTVNQCVCNKQVSENDTVDCNIVNNQMSVQGNDHIKLEPVTVDPCDCNDQVLDNLQQNLSSTVDDDDYDDDIEVTFEAIYDPLVKCEPDLVKSEPSADFCAAQSENDYFADNTAVTVKQEEMENTEADSDVQPYIPELETSAETSNPGRNKDLNICASVFSCAHCNFITKFRSKITSHIVNQHFKISRYHCQECSKSFKHKQNVQLHIKRVHPNKCPYKCLLCNRGFQLEKRYNAHIKNHDKTLQCDVCGKILSTKHTLTEHKMLIHTKSLALSCDMCSKIFYTDKSLKAHTTQVHSNLSFKCDICEKSFKSKSHLVSHQRQVHESVRAFSCNQCEKTFATKFALKSHLVVHSDLRPFKCEKCNSCFNYSSILMRHIRTVHSNKKSLKCHLCEKTFKNKSYLAQHLIRHNDLRSYKCEQCGKQLKTKSGLKRHLPTHSEMRPFACAQCHKKFKSKQHLGSHSRHVHSDLRPFACDKC